MLRWPSRGGERGPDQRDVAQPRYSYAADRSESQEDRVLGRFHATQSFSPYRNLDPIGPESARPLKRCATYLDRWLR